MSFSLTIDQKQFLLATARTAIATELGIQTIAPAPPEVPVTHTSGAFVTIRKSGALRGCIGTMESSQPLPTLISDMAKSSAFGDPRFSPLDSDEYDDILIEISILTPLQRISSPTEVVIGTHGVLIRSGGRSGVLLPQVASEQKWDRTTFLEHTCRKAGLPRDAYLSENVELFVFSAILCDERD